jgi:enterochelin esterase-like enzyme
MRWAGRKSAMVGACAMIAAMVIAMAAPGSYVQAATSQTSAAGQTDTKAAAAPAKKAAAVELIEMAKSGSAELAGAIRASFDEKDLRAGTAWSSHGADFFFALEFVAPEAPVKPVGAADASPLLRVDGKAGGWGTLSAMRTPTGNVAGPSTYVTTLNNIKDTNVWYATAHFDPAGTVHSFDYWIYGKPLGGSQNLPVFTELSYLQPGVPSGVLSEKITHASKIYDGMKSEYEIYVPAEYDPKTPAALMVFQDGIWYTDRDGQNPALNVIDNLIAQKKIPVMICVFIKPGSVTDAPGTPTYTFVKAYSEKWGRTLDDSMRSTLYDTVSDRYARFLRDEILADVGAKYNLRKDAYSRAITGLSSGGICSFNAAWQMPDQFSRVISWIGSFASIQWKEDSATPDGGQDYPDKVLREAHRNIRVWLQDGANDMENAKYGSWPLANLRLANALKLKEYDFHFSFGTGSHSPAHGAAEFPAEMIWLWRDYDASKSEQKYVIEESEKEKAPFRVGIVNRDFAP